MLCAHRRSVERRSREVAKTPAVTLVTLHDAPLASGHARMGDGNLQQRDLGNQPATLNRRADICPGDRGIILKITLS